MIWFLALMKQELKQWLINPVSSKRLLQYQFSTYSVAALENLASAPDTFCNTPSHPSI